MEKLWNWSLAAPWRTWLAHALLSLALAFVFSAFAAFVFYLLREIEQVWEKHQRREQFDWLDHFMDVAAPFLACGLAATHLGW